MQEIEIKVNQAAITPFWRKLPFFFLFPFRFGPGVFLAVLVAASALAGLALGSFGLLAKGFLVYLGLRYAFNVLELFSRGRFEGESPDHRLWGPEKRPGKLGLVLVLFVLIGANLGSIAVANRAVNDPKVQDKLVERYRRDHADELARIEQEQQAWRQKMAKHRIAAAAGARAAAAAEADDASGSGEAAGAPSAALMADEDPPEAPEAAPGREAMIAAAFPGTGDVLWLQLQPVWFWLVMGALSLLLPSAAITIALEDSFFRALNPLNVVRLVSEPAPRVPRGEDGGHRA